MSLFRIGQDVVCVDDTDELGDAQGNGIYQDKVYRIRYINDGYLHFEGHSGGWSQTRFRPIGKALDISVFTLLHTTLKRKLSSDAL